MHKGKKGKKKKKDNSSNILEPEKHLDTQELFQAIWKNANRWRNPRKDQIETLEALEGAGIDNDAGARGWLKTGVLWKPIWEVVRAQNPSSAVPRLQLDDTPPYLSSRAKSISSGPEDPGTREKRAAVQVTVDAWSLLPPLSFAALVARRMCIPFTLFLSNGDWSSLTLYNFSATIFMSKYIIIIIIIELCRK